MGVQAVIPAFTGLEKEDGCVSEVNLGYIVNPRQQFLG